jgi:hypothetical protein
MLKSSLPTFDHSGHHAGPSSANEVDYRCDVAERTQDHLLTRIVRQTLVRNPILLASFKRIGTSVLPSSYNHREQCPEL